MRTVLAFVPVFLFTATSAAAQPASKLTLNFVCSFDEPATDRTVLDVEVNQATNKGSVTVRKNGNRTPVNATFSPTMLNMRHVFSDTLTIEYIIDRVTLAFDQRMLHARGTMSLPGTCQLADAANRKF